MICDSRHLLPNGRLNFLNLRLCRSSCLEEFSARGMRARHCDAEDEGLQSSAEARSVPIEWEHSVLPPGAMPHLVVQRATAPGHRGRFVAAALATTA